ncbi:MAG: VWA domain-containing protein [Planctomycetes bacterium]|nr:VWA domain-containing protein [Planctomycetota bacterium]
MFTITMKSAKGVMALLIECIVLNAAGAINAEEEKAAKEAKKAEPPKIQMAILLDTSGSMRGLINQARSQLWQVVNEFANAKRGDQRPTLEVALYEYGHASLGAESGFMRQILTDNLDKVSEELFQLTIGGSKEYCGQVIDKAARELKWSESNRDLKCIFVAGNEAFTQGPIDFREACKTSANKGVTVSTIFCGARAEGVKTMWLEASKLADGSFMNIDQTKRSFPSPHHKTKNLLYSTRNLTRPMWRTAARKNARRRRIAKWLRTQTQPLPAKRQILRGFNSKGRAYTATRVGTFAMLAVLAKSSSRI